MVGRVHVRRRGNEINRDLSIKLSDRDGLASFTIKDVDGFPIFEVTSKGNIKHKGIIQRTTTN